MQKGKIIAKIGTLSLPWVVAPVVAFAAIQDACALLDRLVTPVRIFGNVILILAVVMILWSGFLFLTAGGNEDTLKKAKSVLIYALIGLAVALLATSARPILQGIFGTSVLTGCTNTLG